MQLHGVVRPVQGESYLHLEEEVAQLVWYFHKSLGGDAPLGQEACFGRPKERVTCFEILCYLSINFILEVTLLGNGIILVLLQV